MLISNPIRHPHPDILGPVDDDRGLAWVAEDDDAMRDLITDTLTPLGVRVEGFANGTEVADALWFVFEIGGRPAPDLVITDIYMPGHTGLDVLAMLRRGDWSVPVIVVTGVNCPAVEREARRLGALAVLEKPLDLRRLGALAARSI